MARPIGGLPNIRLMQEQQARQRAEAQVAQIKALENQGKNSDGSAKDVTYRSKLNPDGTLMDQYKLTDQGPIAADQRAVDAIRDKALATGPSAWASMALAQNQNNMQDQRNSVAQQAASGVAQRSNAIAQRGGMSSGSGERLAKSATRDKMMQNQNIARSGQANALNIGIQDETQKNQMLGQTAGLDFQNAQLAGVNRDYATKTQDQNIARTFDEQAQQRQFDMEQYKAKMAAWGAEKTADAQRAAASRGGKK